MRKPLSLVLVHVLVPILSLAQAAQRHPFTADDAATLRHAETVAVSPEGRTILYKVVFGGSKGPDQTEWKLIATSGGETRNLTLPDKFKPLALPAMAKPCMGRMR